jgi:hypothetical protein
MKIPVDWLLEGESWIEYRTRLDLLDQSVGDEKVAAARKAMLSDKKIQDLVAELGNWPGPVLTNHKSASLLLHKLTFLADLGLTINDPGVGSIVDRIQQHQSPEGPFQVLTNIPVHFGGTGQDQLAWSLCDAPLVVYALAKLGCSGSALKPALTYLVGLCRENGWPCAASKELGKFRGPGRKEDPCPFANLAMLKALSVIPEYANDPVCHSGADSLLTLWSESLSQHPYIFYMGNDFRKLKAPFIWYDLAHALDVLTRFSWLSNGKRLLDMLAVLESKADAQGQFTPESIWTAWKNWEFGQKKVPSRWLTLMAWRILKRARSS